MGIPFVPNFFTGLARSPTALDGAWGAAQHILMGGELPNTLKQMIFVAISSARSCEYCQAAHIAFCKMAGVPDEQIHALAHNLGTLQPKRTQAIVQFAVKCGLDPISLTAEDTEALRRHGLSDSEIMETIAMAGMAVFFNIIADAAHIEIDAEMK